MYEIKNPTQLRIQLTFGRFRSWKWIFKWNLRNVHTADGWISFNVLQLRFKLFHYVSNVTVLYAKL